MVLILPLCVLIAPPDKATSQLSSASLAARSSGPSLWSHLWYLCWQRWKHGIANADSQPWPDSMALKIISNKILLRFPKSWGTPKTSIFGFHDYRKPHMLSPLPQRLLLSKGISTKILAEHMTLTQWYPYAPCMEYLPPFALKITQM
jgi:hypothetical protein